MKVLQINTVCGNGSVGRIAVDIARTLKEAGDDCLIAYGRRTAPEDVKSVRFGTNADMGVHVLSTFFKGEHGFASGAQTDRLIDMIRDYDPDIIHMHNVHGFYLNIEKLFAYLKTAGKPVVWTLHDCWTFTGHCAYFDFAECDKWKNHCEKCPIYRSSYPYALFKDNSKNNFERKKAAYGDGVIPNLTIVTPSAWLADLTRESFLKDYPARVIHNGIDLGRFSPDADGETLRAQLGLQDKFVVLGVANMWEERKGYPVFLELASQLPEHAQIILIGLDKKKLKELPKNIIGIARTDSVEQLAQYYAMADVYVNATREDNFPTTNLEALACGTPVITYDTGGSKESLDETCGLVVPKGDFEGLKQAILSVMNGEKTFAKEDCRSRGVLYDKKDRFEEYRALYEELLKAKNR